MVGDNQGLTTLKAVTVTKTKWDFVLINEKSVIVYLKYPVKPGYIELEGDHAVVQYKNGTR